MTLTLDKYKGNGNYCILEAEGNIYRVMVCPLHKDHTAGYPIAEMTYPATEKAKARATFRRYINKYCK